MSSLSLLPTQAPASPPVQRQSGKNPNAPDTIDQRFEKFHHYEVLMAAASLDVDFKEGFSAIEQYPILHHRPATNGQGRPHDCSFEPGSMQSQMEEAQLASMNLKLPGLKSTIPGSLSAGTFNTSAMNRQSFVFDTSSSFLSPDTANTRAKIKAAGNATHRISAPALALSGERGAWAGVLGQVAERDNSPTQEISVEPRSSLGKYGEHPAPAYNNNGQTVDLAAAKLIDLYGSSNVPHLSTVPTNSADLPRTTFTIIAATPTMAWSPVLAASKVVLQEACATVAAVLGPVRKALHSRTHLAFSAEATTEATRWHQQAAVAGVGMGVGGFNLGPGSPGLAGMPNELNTLLAAQIAAAAGGFGLLGLGVGAGFGTFGGLQSGMSSNGLRGGSGRSGGRSPGLGGGSASGKGGSAGNSGAKDEEDFEPSVLNDGAGWLRTLRLHKYTPNFEGMTWKEMVVMDEQALEAQGVAALGARRKMLKTFEVVCKKTGIDDPSAPPPPSGGSSGGSAGSGGGLSA
ncbi:hypothetical protein EDB85DRAFT_2280747 [Lactarius pseudohatsudake]|nr:hypothetical protein EDB85DRAFT_2280747 [Lactarius pseudohatsudake]